AFFSSNSRWAFPRVGSTLSSSTQRASSSVLSAIVFFSSSSFRAFRFQGSSSGSRGYCLARKAWRARHPTRSTGIPTRWFLCCRRARTFRGLGRQSLIQHLRGSREKRLPRSRGTDDAVENFFDGVDLDFQVALRASTFRAGSSALGHHLPDLFETATTSRRPHGAFYGVGKWRCGVKACCGHLA